MSITNSINKDFLAFFKQQQIKINSKFLVGVSGGSDSMVLLDIGLKVGLNISVAHVNYQLRNEESERESIIVKQYCLENKLNSTKKQKLIYLKIFKTKLEKHTNFSMIWQKKIK